MMDSLIRDLDVATAIRVLQTFASARARQADYVTRWTRHRPDQETGRPFRGVVFWSECGWQKY